MPDSISSISGSRYTLPGFDPYSREGREQTSRASATANAQDSSRSGQPGAPVSKDKTDKNGLTEEQQKQVDELKKIDQRVRVHEQAHVAAGGGLVRGSVHYEYTRGPDGKVYASGGDVSIDTSPEDDPQKTIAKANRIRAAAMAPADPSPQDRAVAAAASQMAASARAEAASETMQKGSSASGDSEKTEKTSPVGSTSQNEETNENIAPSVGAKIKMPENAASGSSPTSNEASQGSAASASGAAGVSSFQPSNRRLSGYLNQAGHTLDTVSPRVFDFRG